MKMSTYSDASLIYYPSGYKAGKAYSLKPTDGSGDLTFTRASTATRVNESGLIESVATGVPRIDFTGGGCGKLLLEPQRTNLMFPSNVSTNWSSIGGTTVTANVTTSPDGTLNATGMYESNTTSVFVMYKDANVSLGSVSIYAIVKTNGRNIQLGDLGGGGGESAKFDLVNGTIIAQNTSNNAYIESYGNGWYKVGFSITKSGTLLRFGIYTLDYETSATTHAGDSTKGIFIYQVQGEQGSYSTSIIPTTTTAVTRVKDDLSLNSASVATIAPTSGFTLFMDFYLSQDQETARFSLFDNAYQNYVYLGSQDRPTNQSIRCEIRGSGVRFINYEPSFTSVGRHKMAVKFLTSGIKVYLDGVEVASSGANAGLSASFQNIVVGRDYPPTAGAIARSITESFMIFPTALSDAEIIALTTL
jgi:hypothetical protein